MEMATDADRQNIYCFAAEQDGQLVGAIFFSRLTFASNAQVFILGPVAVDAKHQGKVLARNSSSMPQ